MAAPIAVFSYKRPIHLKRTLDALKDNNMISESEIYFFSDGNKDDSDIEDVIATRKVISDFCEAGICNKYHVFLAEKNYGLADSVIAGVTEVFKTNDRLIVLEDDILTTKDFLEYMNTCLDYYQDNDEIGAISGYVQDLNIPSNYTKDMFLSMRGNSWGWATWKKVWDYADWDVKSYDDFKVNRKKQCRFELTQKGASQMLIDQMNQRLDSWAIRWDYSFFERNLYTVYPVKTKVFNIGFDGSGTHCGMSDDKSEREYDLSPVELKISDLIPNRTLIERSSDNSFKDILRLKLRSI